MVLQVTVIYFLSFYCY